MYVTSNTPDLDFTKMFGVLHADLPQDPEFNQIRGEYPDFIRKIEVFKDWFQKTFPK